MVREVVRLVSSKYYEKEVVVFGLGHYVKKGDGKNPFSRKTWYFYDKGYYKKFIEDKASYLFDLRVKNSFNPDFITIMPSSKKDSVNSNLKELAEYLSNESKISYTQVLRRNKDIKKTHESKSASDRRENVKESIDITRDVYGKRILLLDNVCISGTSILYCANLLLENGAEEVVGFCLGLSSQGTVDDLEDLDETLKYSEIKRKLLGVDMG